MDHEFGLDFSDVGSVTGVLHPSDALDAETIDAFNALFAEVTAVVEGAAEVAASGQRASLGHSEAAEIAQALQVNCEAMIALMYAVLAAIGHVDKKDPNTV